MVIDRMLDTARKGPLFLKQPEIADVVLNALRDGERKFQCYALHSFVVMPNHVHLLVTPTVVATKWLAPMRGLTTYQGNRILGRQGAFCKVRATITWFEARRSFREFGDISS